ncbi:hypothetical protein Tco_0768382 [Tanacetum coccineum]
MSTPHSEQPTDDPLTPDDVNISDSEDTESAHLPKITTKADWFKPVLEEDTPASPEPDWVIPLNDIPEDEYNWADALTKTTKDPDENKLLSKTGDMGSFIKCNIHLSSSNSKQHLEAFNPNKCRRIRKKKLTKADLEGPAFIIGHRIVPNVTKLLPLGGLPGQVTIQPCFFFNKDLDYLVSGDKERGNALSISKLKVARYLDFVLEELVMSLWIESERVYDISAAYGITHWWFKRKEFYIQRHSALSDRRAVRSHMQILSVISLKTYERYNYTYLKEIVLRRANYKEYKISEADFKNLHPNDFEDLYLLYLQGKLNHLSGADKVHLYNAVNLWIRNIAIRKYFLFKEDYTIVSKPRAVIYRDRSDQKRMMRLNEVHKFSDGTLTRILDKLDHMVKDFKLFEYNRGMENRIWSEDDKRRSEEFIEEIERRLKIRRIFRNLKSFVSGRIRDIDYRLISRTE